MPDTVRTLAALQTLLADNVDGDISAQDIRDMLVSTFGIHQIERQVLGASATIITFDAIPANFSDLRITYMAKTDRADNDSEFLRIRLGATTVDSGASDYGHSMRFQSTSNDFDLEDATASSMHAGIVGGNSASNTVFGGGVIDILNYADTGISTSVLAHAGLVSTAGVISQVTAAGTWYNTTDAVDIIELLGENSNDFDAGSVFTLYGLGTV